MIDAHFAAISIQRNQNETERHREKRTITFRPNNKNRNIYWPIIIQNGSIISSSTLTNEKRMRTGRASLFLFIYILLKAIKCNLLCPRLCLCQIESKREVKRHRIRY